MRSRLLMIQRVALLGAMLLWLGGVKAQAQSVPPPVSLATLVNAQGQSNGGSITINEGGGVTKVFDNFQVTTNLLTLPGGVQVAPSLIVNNDGPGLVFNGAFVNSTTTPVDFHFSYRVTVNGGPLIVDVGLGANPAPLGPGAFVGITENVIPSLGAPLSLVLLNGVITSTPANGMVLLPIPQRQIIVDKDVILTNAFLSTIGQSFSQSSAIPEPSTLLMGCMSVSLLGAGYGWRRLRAARLS